MYCQACGANAPTRYVEFFLNVGMLFRRYERSIKGRMCKPCIHYHFWENTLVTLLMGWWGVISLIVTPFFLLNNLLRYVGCLFMRSRFPEVGVDVEAKLEPHLPVLLSRLKAGEKLRPVVKDLAPKAGVTVAEANAYLQALVREHRWRHPQGC